MKRYALLALALILGCSMLTGCRRQNPNGNMSTPPTEAARPTTEPTTNATIEPATLPATEPITMPDTEPNTEDTTKEVTEPVTRGTLQDPMIK